MTVAFLQLKIRYRNSKIHVSTLLIFKEEGPMECPKVAAYEPIHSGRYVNFTKLRDHVAVISSASKEEKLVNSLLKT